MCTISNVKNVANQKLIYVLSCLCFKYVIKLGVVTWNRIRINFLLCETINKFHSIHFFDGFVLLKFCMCRNIFYQTFFYETKQEMKLTENHAIITLLHQPSLRLLLCGQFPKCGWSFGATN